MLIPIVTYIIVFTWYVRILANLWSYIHLWFVKEYRLDRMQIHLGTSEGKKILILPIRFPPWTPKTVSLFTLSCISLVLCFYLLPLPILIKLIGIDLLSFPVISTWVILFKLPTLLYHRYIFIKAWRKYQRHPLKSVIGITGSYGKTSTKEFISTILSTKFNVLKTEMSKNSVIAAAEQILKKLNSGTEIFVVEMAAYKVHEIEDICQLVKPQVGIMTAINEQHQDLFGSIEQTMSAKYELIQSLPYRGVAIFNADNGYTRELAECAHQDKKRVWMYHIQEKQLPDWVEKKIFASEINVGRTQLTFTVHFEGNSNTVSVQLLGRHQVQNILGAILGALTSSLTFAEIMQAVQLLTPFKATMEPLAGSNGSLFINDTFNNNPDAAIAALNYLRVQSGKKIFIFQPMIELGKFTSSAHQKVGESAAQVADRIFLTNSNNAADFIQGVRNINPKHHVQVANASEISKSLRNFLDRETLVLFKGKQAAVVLNQLLH